MAVGVVRPRRPSWKHFRRSGAIGAAQAGLSVGRHLLRRGRPFVIPDAGDFQTAGAHQSAGALSFGFLSPQRVESGYFSPGAIPPEDSRGSGPLIRARPRDLGAAARNPSAGTFAARHSGRPKTSPPPPQGNKRPYAARSRPGLRTTLV